MNELINLRDAALRLATGERAGEVLNDQPPPAQVPTLTPDALAAALRDLKVAAISADGAQVDYAALAHSPAYAAYRDLTYGLRSFDLAQLDQRPAQLAFWINLYNGLVLDAVVRYGIRRSVTERLAGLGFFRRAPIRSAGCAGAPTILSTGCCAAMRAIRSCRGDSLPPPIRAVPRCLRPSIRASTSH